MISASARLLFYKRKDIQEALVAAAEDREIAVRYGDGFGKRPDILSYPADVLQLAMRGATSFHCSEELWINPLQIGSNMKRYELDDLRKGWDLILDIDCDEWEYSKYAAHLVVEALKHYNIQAISVKFSGNHGFHIGVPFESFPSMVHGQEMRTWFPNGPRKIAAKLGDMIKPHLAKKMLEMHKDAAGVAACIGKEVSDIMTNGEFDAFKVLVIDTILISSRHLYRMPYSFNEKSGWVSVPVSHDNILNFDREKQGAPGNVVVSELKFLDRLKCVPNEGRELVIQAFDHNPPREEYKIKTEKKDFEPPSFALQEEYFPPCVKLLLGQLDDGKKRAMFVLTNFMRSVGWDYEKIEARLWEWNDIQAEPLREVILQGHLNHHQRKKGGTQLPPNCANVAYYKDLLVCKPDRLCNKFGNMSIKNPVRYSMQRIKQIQWAERNKEFKDKEREAGKHAREMQKQREIAAQIEDNDES